MGELSMRHMRARSESTRDRSLVYDPFGSCVHDWDGTLDGQTQGKRRDGHRERTCGPKCPSRHRANR